MKTVIYLQGYKLIYLIGQNGKPVIWIESPDGEAAAFDEDQFKAMLDDYFETKF